MNKWVCLAIQGCVAMRSVQQWYQNTVFNINSRHLGQPLCERQRKREGMCPSCTRVPIDVHVLCQTPLSSSQCRRCAAVVATTLINIYFDARVAAMHVKPKDEIFSLTSSHLPQPPPTHLSHRLARRKEEETVNTSLSYSRGSVVCLSA